MRHEQQTRKKFNKLKRYYDKTWDMSDHTLHVGVFNSSKDSLEDAYQNANNLLVNKLFALSPILSNSYVFDVGCGAGRTLIKLCERFGCRGVGIDISDEQITDAKLCIKQLNVNRKQRGQKELDVRFVRGSASELNKHFKNRGVFTHVMSQDSIFLVQNKKSLFFELHELMSSDGVCVLADFIKENSEEKKETHRLIHELVNWTDSLSEKQYKKVLATQGLEVVELDRRDSDMVKTYSCLVERIVTQSMNDLVLSELKQRYESIVKSVKSGDMGWVFISARRLR